MNKLLKRRMDRCSLNQDIFNTDLFSQELNE